MLGHKKAAQFRAAVRHCRAVLVVAAARVGAKKQPRG